MSQHVLLCKKRFQKYLNHNNSLNHLVRFDNDAVRIYSEQGKLEFTAWEKEIPLLGFLFESMSAEELMNFYINKGNKRLNKKEIDSLWICTDKKIKTSTTLKSKLTGKKIAIDAGHLAGSFSEAMKEQKYLYFVKDSLKNPYDTIKLYESELTYHTSIILKKLIEQEGGKVFLTRNELGQSAFGISYSEWYKKNKMPVLDSLFSLRKIDEAERTKFIKANEYDFFWQFFRDYELQYRAKIINEYQPDITIIIHYNVDEKNEPWKKCTSKNYTMAFIGGAFTADRLGKNESKLNFLRLLFGNQLSQSEKLSSCTVNRLSKDLQIPPALQTDADYLKKHCKPTGSKGVFSRQLILCNAIQSPLVYSECLYQDNEKECELLMKKDKKIYGIETSDRVISVAQSLFKAILDYYSLP